MKKAELLKCCGSTKWAKAMLKAQPFPSVEAMLRKSDEIFASLGKTDLLEAFSANARVLDSELYERRFGFSFVIDTDDKSIEDIVAAMNARMSNGPHAELAIAAEEQRKITRGRLVSALRESS
jgi:2-oxo-4-hydroxy-4-carboxy--5-ureidoimidazoline (OHCU) decarboxylase